MMPRVPYWAAALLFTAYSTASPSISFPLNSQVPPIARVGQPFSFTFSLSTFSSSSPITYSLFKPPRWLFLDSNAQRLFGTPGEEDVPPGRVAAVPLDLVATDDSGSTTPRATLGMSRSASPQVEIPLAQQVPEIGIFSSPSTILCAPDKDFSFKLNPNTFSKPPGAPMSYYATMADNTPLPAWISFDPSRLSFTGRTPPAEYLLQPPQQFAVQVIASDVVGFAGASLPFDIVVGSHRLLADETTVFLNATPGRPLTYTGLRDVKIDGKPATAQTAVVASTRDLPPWLSINNDTWVLSGTPPGTAKSTNFTITIRDTHSNTLNLTFAVAVTNNRSGLFNGNLPRLTITAGKPFSFDLRPYLAKPGETDISVEIGPSSPWIKFDLTRATLFGVAPDGLESLTIIVKITARSKVSKFSDSIDLDIIVRSPSESDGTGVTPGSDSSSPASNSSEPSDGKGLGNSRFNPVLLAVLLPLLLLLGLAICLLFWYFRQRTDHPRPRLTTRDISSPLPGSFVVDASPQRSLSEFTNHFSRSFWADDLFGLEDKSFEPDRTVFLTRADLPQPGASARLLSPHRNSAPDLGHIQEVSRTPVIDSGTGGTLRAPRGKISSSLSLITEKSIGDLVDSRDIGSLGNRSRTSLMDKIEITVPRLQTSYTGTPSPTENASTPQTASSLASSSSRIRTESRLSLYYPPVAAVRKLSWPWIRGREKRRGTVFGPGLKRLSERPRILTVGTASSETPGQGKASPQQAQKTSFPPPRASSSQAIKTTETEDTPRTGNSTPQPATPSPPQNTAKHSPASGALNPKPSPTPRDSLEIHTNPTTDLNANPFQRPSNSWSTVSSNLTDEWVDDTVESLALSKSATINTTTQPQQNWVVLQEEDSPAAIDRGATVLGRAGPEVGSSSYLSLGEWQGQEHGGQERSGLGRRSVSKGVVSMRSEGSRLGYAVFI